MANPCNTCSCNAAYPCDTFRNDIAPPEADAGADIDDSNTSAPSAPPPAGRRPGTAARARFAFDFARRPARRVR